ncbi:Rcbtb1 [Symbiodinium necroappetens]|uniref:Rcbtb1 protein n=1 Tax=Symbiodinium necroappetens TaxID=1628268 RepID=A0A812QHL1_9DINO|nr:Rcbtb1 [Symbiodinium necroappetens]
MVMCFICERQWDATEGILGEETELPGGGEVAEVSAAGVRVKRDFGMLGQEKMLTQDLLPFLDVDAGAASVRLGERVGASAQRSVVSRPAAALEDPLETASGGHFVAFEFDHWDLGRLLDEQAAWRHRFRDGPSESSLKAVFARRGLRLDDGTVKCWGYNNQGQLGLGTTEQMGDGTSEMGDYLPAVLDDGTVKCWGFNSYGQLGLGTTDSMGDGSHEMGDYLPAVSLGTGRSAVEVAAGACARLDDGSVKCWGRNRHGQLGLGTTDNMGDGSSEMGDYLPAVSLGTGRSAVELAPGDTHTCARLDDGAVKCWGYNLRGELGLGTTDYMGDGSNEMADHLPPIDIIMPTTTTTTSKTSTSSTTGTSSTSHHKHEHQRQHIPNQLHLYNRHHKYDHIQLYQHLNSDLHDIHPDNHQQPQQQYNHHKYEHLHIICLANQQDHNDA